MCTIISICYVVTLIRTLVGSGYKIIVLTIVFLLVANISYVILLATNYVLIHFLLGDYPDMTDETLYKVDFVQCFTQSVGDLFYCWGHWIIAVYYKKIANNMPRVILTSRDELVPVKKYKTFLWVGLACNAVGPIGEGIFLYLYLKDYH